MKGTLPCLMSSPAAPPRPPSARWLTSGQQWLRNLTVTNAARLPRGMRPPHSSPGVTSPANHHQPIGSTRDLVAQPISSVTDSSRADDNQRAGIYAF
ncbi:hypothetical protein AAFF_G00266100 [Aldrovandia affinis]|uniref:Uncharacterized protein n=1 Tax=Aldrovandia affinis TaxID=143900 RepID=A0AAD7W1V5_9TELE|nr:hypothetical protein AAFF_G00266100 [Aldrovandia affinis]